MTPYYEESGITIYHGDCRDILPTLPKVDLVLTDPPYGIGAVKRGTIGTSKKGAVKDYGKAEWDNETPPAWIWGLLADKSTNQIIFGGNFFPLPPSSCWLVWDKDNTGDFADCELAWTNLTTAVRRIRWRWNGMLQEDMSRKEFRCHPTQKPLAVIKWALKQAPEGCGTVLDPFMGVGTTLLAARDLGLSAIGIEREEAYCANAVERLRQNVMDFGPRDKPDEWMAALGAQDILKEEAVVALAALADSTGTGQVSAANPEGNK